MLLMVRELGQGGTERQLTEIARALNRARFQPHVGCFRPQGIRGEELRRAGVPVVGSNDEIQYSEGHKYVTLVYQIEQGLTRLLWVRRNAPSHPSRASSPSLEKRPLRLVRPLVRSFRLAFYIWQYKWPSAATLELSTLILAPDSTCKMSVYPRSFK